MSSINRQTSQGTRLLIQSGDLGAGTAVASATKAKPAVITFSALPPEFVAGAIVMPNGTDWKSLDGRPFQIASIDTTAKTITLADSDSSAEANAINITGTVAAVDMIEACMATLTFTGPAGTDVDLTTMCDHARVTKPGLPGISTWQATGFWDITDQAQRRLRDLFRSREVVAMEAVYPDGSGLAFTASVSSFDVRAGVDQGVAITVGGTLSGAVSFVEPVAGAGTLSAPPPPAPAPAPVAA